MRNTLATAQQFQQDERSVGRYDFEGGGYIRILIAGDVSTGEALDMAESIILLKRKEIERSATTDKERMNDG